MACAWTARRGQWAQTLKGRVMDLRLRQIVGGRYRAGDGLLRRRQEGRRCGRLPSDDSHPQGWRDG